MCAPILREASPSAAANMFSTGTSGSALLRCVTPFWCSRKLPAGSRAQAYVLHTNAPQDARELGEWARRTFHCVEYHEQDAGPVLATHVGPGVVALGFFKED